MILAHGLLAFGSLLALQSAPSGDGDAAAKSPPSIDSAVARAVTRIVEMQESLSGEKSAPRAEWPYQGVYREDEMVAPVGYRVGGTAICAWALIASPQYAESEEAQAAVARGVDLILEMLEVERMNSDFVGGYDVRGWGHAYALNLFLELRARKLAPKKRAKDIDKAVTKLVELLQKTEIVETGGWNYSRPKGGDASAPASPFMTAPTLFALYEAKQQGEKVDGSVVARALDALEGSRTEDGAIPYSTGKNRKDEWPGAIGRSPATEVALLLAGRSDVARIRKSLENFFEHWEWLEKRRRQTGTHIPPYQIAPYYFFYAHAYAGMAIEFLPEGEREGFRKQLHARLFQVQEPSGGWNDRVFERSENYGTAMATLAFLSPSLRRPPEWTGLGAAGSDKKTDAKPEKKREK